MNAFLIFKYTYLHLLPGDRPDMRPTGRDPDGAGPGVS